MISLPFNELEILVDNKKLDSLKILHLSDLHINKKTSIKDLNKLINFCNATSFDICVITGDIIDCQSKIHQKKT